MKIAAFRPVLLKNFDPTGIQASRAGDRTVAARYGPVIANRGWYDAVMSGMLLTEYVPKIERLSVDLQERGRALGLGGDDVRPRYFIATANALSMYAVSWTLIHAAQQFGRGNFTTIVDGAPVRTEDQICPRIVDALFRNAYEAGGTLWNGYMGKLKAHLFHDAWGAFEDALRRVYSAVVPTAQQDEDAGLDAAGKRRHIDLPKMWKRLADVTKANGSHEGRPPDVQRTADVVMRFKAEAD